MKLNSLLSLGVLFIVMNHLYAFEAVTMLKVFKNEELYAYALFVPHSSDRTHNWQNFHRLVFEFPDLLNQEKHDAVPVIIIMPEQYQNIKTTDGHAPLYEGARVALTWASAQFRFSLLGSVDIRVILVPSEQQPTEQMLLTVIEKVMGYSCKDDTALSPEQQFEQRLFSFNQLYDSSFLSSLQIFPFNKEPKWNKKEPMVISPNLPAYDFPKKRIVITGGAGFIGSYLAKRLLVQGHQVIVLDNLLCATMKNLEDIKHEKNFAFYCIDVACPFWIEGPVDVIIHAASVPSPLFYYKMPTETLVAGLHGTKLTLDLAQKKGSRYIFTSTSEVYGDPHITPQAEEYAGNVNPIGKRSQYDQSKRGAETLIKLYFEKYGIDVRIARIFNTYGPGMQLNDGRVVTNFIYSILSGTPITIYGTGNQTRSFCYIDDTVAALLALILCEEITYESTIERRIFNIGNPTEYTINEIAQKASLLSERYLEKKAVIKHIENIDLDDPKQRNPDLTRINGLINFIPNVTLDEGLEKTFRYFLKEFTDTSMLLI